LFGSCVLETQLSVEIFQLLEIQALLRTIQSEMNSYVEEANLSEKKSQKVTQHYIFTIVLVITASAV